MSNSYIHNSCSALECECAANYCLMHVIEVTSHGGRGVVEEEEEGLLQCSCNKRSCDASVTVM